MVVRVNEQIPSASEGDDVVNDLAPRRRCDPLPDALSAVRLRDQMLGTQTLPDRQAVPSMPGSRRLALMLRLMLRAPALAGQLPASCMPARFQRLNGQGYHLRAKKSLNRMHCVCISAQARRLRLALLFSIFAVKDLRQCLQYRGKALASVAAVTSLSSDLLQTGQRISPPLTCMIISLFLPVFNGLAPFYLKVIILIQE